MICRLCLENVTENNATELFSNTNESELVKIIAKYLLLQLTETDSISTSICHDCSMHLNDFHRFCKYVDERQSTVQNEFFEVKCGFKVQGQLAAEPLIDQNEESPSDIKDVLVDCEPPPQRRKSRSARIDRVADNITNEIQEYVSFRSLDSAEECVNSVSSGNKRRRQKSRQSTKTSNIKHNNVPTLKENLRICDKESVCGPCPVKEFNSSTSKTKITDKLLENDTESDELIARYLLLKCDICEDSMETFAKLKEHFSTAHNCQGYVECCGRRFKKRYRLVDHIIMHLNPQYFQCKICNINLKSRYSLDMHLQSKHSKREDLKFDCSVCGKKFACRTILKYHSLKHQAEKQFSCKLCDKAFVTQYRLNLHIQAIHDNISPYVCDYCGRKFKTKPSFMLHVAQHEGKAQPPAQCNICGEWFKHQNSLKKHIKKHSAVEVECDLCGRMCPTNVALQSHIRYIHQKKSTLQCIFCSKTFKMKRSLEEHIAIHTGEKHNPCPHCPKEFRSKANMYVHIKKEHFEEWSKNRSKAPPSMSI